MTDIPYRVRLESDDARGLAAALVGSGAVGAVSVQGRVLTVETMDLSGLGRLVAPLARSRGMRLSLFEPEDLSLESVFRYLVRGR
jgi:ABC-2 type transport system ATP-binding protein